MIKIRQSYADNSKSRKVQKTLLNLQSDDEDSSNNSFVGNTSSSGKEKGAGEKRK